MRRLTNGGTRRVAAGLAVTAALLVPLAVFGAPALARSAAAASQYEYSSGSQYQYRVQICHVTGSKHHPAHTITVSSAAVKAHLRHGDHLGACTGTETARHHGHGPATSSTPSTAPSNHGHGNAGGNGNGNGNGHHK
jgi:hypothetical protein